jgi:hypothetical protein
MKITQIGVLLLLSLCACSKQDPVVKKLDSRGAKVGIMVIESPKAVGASGEFTVRTLVRNVGEQTLPALGGAVDDALQVNMAYHWLSMDGKPVIWDGLRTPIGAALRKSDSREVKLTVRAPPTPGDYVLEVDVVQEKEFWFGGVGSQTARMNVNVR